MAVCQLIPSITGFTSGIIGFLDCQAQAIGAAGYQALAAPGSSALLVLTGMLTLFVALIGYRMLFGHTPGVREGVLTFVKIGVVLALATGWPAYQTLVYDVVLRSPADLAATIGAPAGLPGAGGGLVTRLDAVDVAFERLAILGVGNPPLDANGQAIYVPTAPPLFVGFDNFALGGSRVGFLIGAIGAFALVRLAAGLLLALGPLFIGFLLFDGTRGLFEGWARALIGTALGALATAIVLGVELALIEPWLADLLARRYAGDAILAVPAQLLSVTIVFAFALLGLLLIVGRVALGLRLPFFGRSTETNSDNVARAKGVVIPSQISSGVPHDSRTRAAAIADSIAISQRRDAGPGGATMPSTTTASGGLRAPSRTSDGAFFRASPSVQHVPRRTGSRVSASALRRDRPS